MTELYVGQLVRVVDFTEDAHVPAGIRRETRRRAMIGQLVRVKAFDYCHARDHDWHRWCVILDSGPTGSLWPNYWLAPVCTGLKELVKRYKELTGV